MLFARYFGFFMCRVLPAPLAEFFELDFSFNGFLVFARVIIPVGADRTLEPY